MPNSLWILKESTNLADVRAMLDCYLSFTRARKTLINCHNQLWPGISRELVPLQRYVGIVDRDPERIVCILFTVCLGLCPANISITEGMILNGEHVFNRLISGTK